LKCKGCTHFASLCGDNNFADVDEFKRNLAQIAEKVYIGQLRLLGGEPLLHKGIADSKAFKGNFCLYERK